MFFLFYFQLFSITAGLEAPRGLYRVGSYTVQWSIETTNNQNLQFLVLIEYGKNEILKRFTNSAEFDFKELTELDAILINQFSQCG